LGVEYQRRKLLGEDFHDICSSPNMFVHEVEEVGVGGKVSSL